MQEEGSSSLERARGCHSAHWLRLAGLHLQRRGHGLALSLWALQGRAGTRPLHPQGEFKKTCWRDHSSREEKDPFPSQAGRECSFHLPSWGINGINTFLQKCVLGHQSCFSALLVRIPFRQIRESQLCRRNHSPPFLSWPVRGPVPSFGQGAVAGSGRPCAPALLLRDSRRASGLGSGQPTHPAAPHPSLQDGHRFLPHPSP